MFLQKLLGTKSAFRGVNNTKERKDASYCQDVARQGNHNNNSNHLSLGGTSLTSTRFKSMLKATNQSPNSKLVEISEEYDIESVVSGLTRNSQFVDQKDPPENNSNKENIEDLSAQWPDDEILCRHVIHVVETPPVHQSKKIISEHQYNKCTNVPSSEPFGRRYDSPPKGSKVLSYYSSKQKMIHSTNDSAGYEVVLPYEPDGIIFGINEADKPKIRIEPSGKKIGTFPRSSIKENSRGRSIVVLPDDRDVEVVYGENNKYSEESAKENTQSISRGRSKSTNTRRTRTNMIPWKTADGSRNNSSKSKEDIPCLSDAKKMLRSRSLPRTLRKLTSRYLKSPQGSKVRETTLKPREVAVEHDIVSSLGSHFDGCDSPQSERSKSLHRKSPAPSDKVCEIFEPRVCVEFSRRQSGGYFQTTRYSDQKSSDVYGRKIGRVNGSRRYTSKLFDIKSRQETHKKEENVTKETFTRHDTTATQERPLSRESRDRKAAKMQVQAITKEACRNLLLGPSIKDQLSIVEDEEFVERLTENLNNKYTPVKEDSIRDRATKKDSTTYPVSTDFIYRSIPVTPSPSKDTNNISSLAKTSDGRKSLIQKYLLLRESMNEKQVLVPGSSNDSSSFNNNSLRSTSSGSAISEVTDNAQKSSCRKRHEYLTSGRGDASRFYRPANSARSLFRENNDQNIRPTTSATRFSQITGNSMVKKIFPERTEIDIDATDYNDASIENKIYSSPPLNHHISPQEKNISYSYFSDDESLTSSSEYDTYKSVSITPKPVLSSYADEHSPHNIFMKMKLGLGPQ